MKMRDTFFIIDIDLNCAFSFKPLLYWVRTHWAEEMLNSLGTMGRGCKIQGKR